MRWVAPFCRLVGAMDTLTGLCLVAAPRLTLRFMGLTAQPGELVLLRFIGVFVGCVGLSYLLTLLGDRALRRARLLGVLELTTLFRAAVALFVVSAVAARGLEPGWLSVAVSDALVAAVQIRILASGALRAEA